MNYARPFSGVIGAIAIVVLGCDRSSAESRQETIAAASASRIESACSTTLAPRVSRDSIGPLDTRSSLAALKQQCAGEDTTFHGPESAFPGVVFHFDSLLVIGFQYSESLDLMQPAAAWVAVGCGGRLSANVSTCATWQEIVAVFGRSGSGSTENRYASITLDRLAGFELTFDVTYEEVGSLEVQSNLDSMPASAKLLDVAFIPARNVIGGRYIWGAEVSTFRPCGDSLTYWVTGRDSLSVRLRALHGALTTAPYQDIFLEVRGAPTDGERDGFAAEYDGLFRVDLIVASSATIPPSCVDVERQR